MGRDASMFRVSPLPLEIKPVESLIGPSTMFDTSNETYPLLSWIFNILVCLKQRPNVQSLSPPKIPVNRPIKGKFQGAPIKRSEEMSNQ